MKLKDLTYMGVYGKGFWISPTGNIIKVTKNHVSDIIDNPSKFGVTTEYIQQIYDKHNEKLYTEGEAREDLIRFILQRGWIRIRHYKNHWSVTLFKMTPKVKKMLRDWIYSFVEQKVMFNHDDIKIFETSRDKLTTMTATDILSYKLEESTKLLNIVTFQDEPDLPT